MTDTTTTEGPCGFEIKDSKKGFSVIHQRHANLDMDELMNIEILSLCSRENQADTIEACEEAMQAPWADIKGKGFMLVSVDMTMIITPAVEEAKSDSAE